jgi:hypothetical protein
MLLPVPLATIATAALLAVGTSLAVATPTELLASEELSGTLSERRPIERRHQGKDKREGELPSFNYYLDESDPDTVILRRQDGSFVAAFSADGATKEGIVKAAMEDYRALVRRHESKQSQSPTEDD